MSELDIIKKEFHPVKILHRAGDLKSAVTADGEVVRRQEELYASPEYGMVKVAGYDNQFVFIDPGYEKGIVGRSKFMCSCGSLAVIVGANVYSKDASPSQAGDGGKSGQLLVCWMHASTGKHADGSS